MRILWILPYSPWPATSGGKTRQFHLLRSLAARGHRITLLLHDKHPVSPADRQVLEAFVEQLIILPRRPLRSLKTLVAGLFAPYPLLASVNGLAGELQDTFNWLLGEQWDVVQIEHSYSFQPYEDALARKSQPFVLTEHNVESALGAATYDRLPRWSLPFIRYDQWRYARWERRVMRRPRRWWRSLKTMRTSWKKSPANPCRWWSMAWTAITSPPPIPPRRHAACCSSVTMNTRRTWTPSNGPWMKSCRRSGRAVRMRA